MTENNTPATKPVRKRAPRKAAPKNAPTPAPATSNEVAASSVGLGTSPSVNPVVQSSGWVYDQEANELRFAPGGGEGK